MTNRKAYDEDLAALNASLSQMGSLASENIRQACLLLMTPDQVTAQQIIENDSAVDKMEQQIEHQCLELLLRQQPVATDLRRVSTALKLVTDLERIGDHAADIAEITLALQAGWQLQIPVDADLERMAAAAQDMIDKAIRSFIDVDVATAEQVIDQDDVVDGLFDAIKTELAAYIAVHPREIDAALDLLMVTKYFERLGDHAVNIAQWVCFLKTGVYRGQQIV